MTSSGMEEILASAFGSLPKMLSGKSFPQNVCALTLLAEKISRLIFKAHTLASMADFKTVLFVRK